jgi:hypothetical protein
MNQIKTHNVTGKVILCPVSASPEADYTIRNVTPEIKTVLSLGGPFLWDNENGVLTRVERVVPVPVSVEAYKVIGKLASLGISETAIEDMIKAQIPEGPAQLQALNEFRRTTSFQRAHPLIEAIGAALGFDTPAKVDQFFRDCKSYKYGA